MGILNPFCPGVGNSPIKRMLGGFARGVWSGLELTDTLFLDTLAVILWKKSEIVGECFFQLWKCNLVGFIEI